MFLQSGKSTCLFHSFASALHFLGLVEAAKAVNGQAENYAADSLMGAENWKALQGIMNTICPWMQPKKINPKTYNILHDIDIYPTVMCLQAIDGGTQHAVTVVGKFVFDSNCSRAMPLTEETLDYCCSTDEKESKFLRVFHGYRFQEPLTKQKKKLYWMNRDNPFLADMMRFE